ncbi:MAG: WXG100 family type VII secretion target [Actinomycetota bacterium]
MPAGQLHISFEELRSKGQTLMTKADELQGQLDLIHGIAQPDGIWDGAAASSYQSEFDRWSTAQRTMIESLREMGAFLQRAASAYEGTELEIQRALGLSA